MIKLSELIKYREYLEQLEGENPVYPNVEASIPDDTLITEKWFNGKTERFHQYTFKAEDLPKVNKRLYDKLRYVNQKTEAQ